MLDVKDNDFFMKCFGYDNSIHTLKSLIKNGTLMSNAGKRKVNMYCFGCTVGASKTPRLVANCTKSVDSKKKQYHYIPRPYKNYKPTSSKKVEFEKNRDLCALVHHIEEICFKYLLQIKDAWSREAYIALRESKEITPKECRIFDTGFNFMSLNGDLQSSTIGIKPHLDNEDYFNFVLHVGQSVEGGSTVYTKNGSNKKMSNILSVPFHHGLFQICRFSHVYHGSTPWKGKRCSINLAIKKKPILFFQKFGLCYYKKYIVDQNYELSNIIVDTI